jgi:hypothetical protein
MIAKVWVLTERNEAILVTGKLFKTIESYFVDKGIDIMFGSVIAQSEFT